MRYGRFPNSWIYLCSILKKKCKELVKEMYLGQQYRGFANFAHSRLTNGNGLSIILEDVAGQSSTIPEKMKLMLNQNKKHNSLIAYSQWRKS